MKFHFTITELLFQYRNIEADESRNARRSIGGWISNLWSETISLAKCNLPAEILDIPWVRNLDPPIRKAIHWWLWLRLAGTEFEHSQSVENFIRPKITLTYNLSLNISLKHTTASPLIMFTAPIRRLRSLISSLGPAMTEVPVSEI